MRKEIIALFVCMLLITTATPIFGTTIMAKSICGATSEENQLLSNEKSLTDTVNLVLPHQIKIIFHHLLKRQYLLYVPTSYTGGTPVPLVVVFHGGPNTPENASGRFGISEKAEEEGFIVAYANASEIALDFWLLGYGLFTSNILEELFRLWIDEVGYVKKIIRKTQNQFNIDPDRIYLAGHSNGAMFAYLLASKLSDIVAAIASNGGCIGGHLKNYSNFTIPAPKNPVSIVIFHGKQDYVVPYNGGWTYDGSSYFKSVAEAVSFWVEHNGCNATPMTNDTVDIIIDRYSGGTAGTEVLVYSLKYKGHIWFGGQPWEDPNPVISTTDEMWKFFEAHPKQ
jgi:polyhydroxybutyrate depolymerase